MSLFSSSHSYYVEIKWRRRNISLGEKQKIKNAKSEYLKMERSVLFIFLLREKLPSNQFSSAAVTN